MIPAAGSAGSLVLDLTILVRAAKRCDFPLRTDTPLRLWSRWRPGFTLSLDTRIDVDSHRMPLPS